MRPGAALLGALFFWLAGQTSARAAPLGITIAETGTGIRITYDLPRPAIRLLLRPQTDPPPPGGTHIRVSEPGLSYRDGQIEGRRAFRRATLIVTPDDGDVQRRYPLLTAITGRGFVLFAPYLLPDAPIALRVADGGGRLRPLPRAEAMGGYVPIGFIPGPRGDVRVAASTTMPAALEARLVERASGLLGLYRARLGHGLRRAPVLILSFLPPGEAGRDPVFRGDVTRNNVVMLRFRGTEAEFAAPAMAGPATAFLAHELFHLWGQQGDETLSNEAILGEGAAQYYGWLAVAELWPGEIDLEANLLAALNHCAAFLGHRALVTLNPMDAVGTNYTCGPVMQWVADVGIRAAEGRHTGFDLWAGLFAARRDYGAFRNVAARMAPGTFPFLLGLVERGARWNELAPALNAAGAEIQALAPTRQPLLFAATKAIVESMCEQYWGAGFDSRGVYFNSEPCGLPGTFTHIERIDGTDPMADADAYYRRVRDACARRAEMVLRLRGEAEPSERRIRCTAGIDPPIPDFRIIRALPPGPPVLNPPARSSRAGRPAPA